MGLLALAAPFIAKAAEGIFNKNSNKGENNNQATGRAGDTLSAELPGGVRLAGNGKEGISAVKDLVGSRQSQPVANSIPTSTTTGLNNPLTLRVSTQQPPSTGTSGTTTPGTGATPVNNPNNSRPIQITFA